MNFFHLLKKTSLTAICLALMLSLAACRENEEKPQETQGDTSTSQEDTQPGISNDTEVPTEDETNPPMAETLSIQKDQLAVVYPSFSALWEETAANDLAVTLGLEKALPENEASKTAFTIHVGYTDEGRDYAETLATIGDLGSICAVTEERILLLANTETGLARALETFKQNLEKTDGGYNYPLHADDISVLSSEAQEVVLGEGAWAEQLAYAKSLENGVYTEFLDNGRTKWKLANQNAVFYYDMYKKSHCFAAITTPEGIPYVKQTGYTYLVGENETIYSVGDSAETARTNTFELGYYFYNAHVMGASFGPRNRDNPMSAMTLDKTFYLYSDKLNTVQHFVASVSDCTGIYGYGQYFDIPEERVLDILVKDATGYHHFLEDVDWETAEYVGFDIERAGIFGIILVKDAGSGQLKVTHENGVFRVDQRVSVDPSTVFAKGTHIYMGQRIYTDENHNFEAFQNEADAERNPLTTVGVHKKDTNSGYLQYNALRGAYQFLINGNGFVGAYYNDPDTHYKVHPEITSDELDRKIYVYSQTISGALENAVILDENGKLLPISAEVCKNFQGENEESTYDPGDTSYGRTYIPLYLRAGETKKFTIVNLYQNWGQFPLKQLSSVQFTSPYYHLSLGVTETNCIAPTFVYGRDHWLLPDFRSMSAPLWSSQPQHTAVGGLNVMEFTDSKRQNSKLENSTDHIDSYGPVYADVTMDYCATDGRIEATYRHVEMPHTDENRTYYEIEIRINEDITFKEFRKDFYLFRFHSRLWHFSKLGYLDGNNQHQILECVKGTTENRYIKLGSEAPYYEYHACSDPNNNDYVNFALIVKDFSAIIGGEAYTGGLMLRDFYLDNRNFGDLTLDLGEVTLKAGDSITLKMILLPWGSQLSTDNSNVLNVREDSVLNPYTLSVTEGTEIQDTYIPKVLLDDNGKAEFTIRGGSNNVAIRVYGLSDYEKPTIEEYIDGAWVAYDTSYHDYDGYMVYNDGDGTFSVAFCVDMTGTGENGRTFRVVD
ncbi:MAG: hypothetical protein E7645_05150 [Ruminococcaceae bacterium]|nr:hypothetical protein [Oscillospiraceae bacterium]